MMYNAQSFQRIFCQRGACQIRSGLFRNNPRTVLNILAERFQRKIENLIGIVNMKDERDEK